MKNFLNEFKKFALNGNVVDLAVGVITGAALNAIVNSLVNDILSPIIGLFTGKNLTDNTWQIGQVTIGYGAFITAVINFFFTALVLFIFIKAINKAKSFRPKEEVPKTKKECPFCKSEIDINASRCPYCTSEIK